MTQTTSRELDDVRSIFSDTDRSARETFARALREMSFVARRAENNQLNQPTAERYRRLAQRLWRMAVAVEGS